MIVLVVLQVCGVYEWFWIPPTAASPALQPRVPREMCRQVAEGKYLLIYDFSDISVFI